MLKILRIESDFKYDSKHSFYRFYKEYYNKFEEMSQDSKYNNFKKFTNLLTIFKNLKPKNPTQLKKEQIIIMIKKMILTMVMG